MATPTPPSPRLPRSASARATPEDPEWGHTSFRPAAPNPARRASLFDLPNPARSPWTRLPRTRAARL